ncbi:outer membrane beta-barrel protein [Haliea sp. E17]|uniref:surface lipoprotein assembly modifier n=1 Tax=Haliea sp. E17 TaxID=3401576 RepID=UPI003AACCFEE
MQSLTIASEVNAVEPANMAVGPVYLTPTVETSLGYVDNLFRSSDDEKSTGVSEIKPKLQAWLQNGLNTYSLTVGLADYRYFDSSADDFTDLTLNLDLHHEFNARNVANVFGEYSKGHEERGTGLAETGISQQLIFDKPVKLDRTILGGDYTYGSQLSSGRLKLAAKATDHDYQNFEQYTQFRSRDLYDYAGTFFWKVAPKTDLLLEARYADVQYKKDNPLDRFGSLDSEEYNYFIGAEWAATAKTSGSIRLGMFDRQYDSDARQNDDGFSWEADITWQPRSYSSFNFETRRFTQETNGQGNAVDTKDARLSWNHGWNSRTQTDLSFGGGVEDYTGSARKDDVYTLDAQLSYALQRWVDLGLGYRWEDRDSSNPFFDYTRNYIFLEAGFSL